jgi:hypothetical protein
VSKRRHNLSDESVRATTVLQSWCTLPGAVLEEDIIVAFQNKAKRPRGKGITETDSIVIDD